MDGPIEIVGALSARPLVKGLADIGTKQAKLNKLLFFDRRSRVLTGCEPEPDRRGRGRNVPWPL